MGTVLCAVLGVWGGGGAQGCNAPQRASSDDRAPAGGDRPEVRDTNKRRKRFSLDGLGSLQALEEAHEGALYVHLGTRALLRRMGPQALADLILQQDGRKSGRVVEELFGALRDSGTFSDRLAAAIELYERHACPLVVQMTREYIWRHRAKAPWKVAREVLRKERQKTVSAVLTYLAELGPLTRDNVESYRARKEVLDILIGRLRSSQADPTFAAQCNLILVIVAIHGTPAQVDRTFRLLRSPLRWNRLAILLAENCRQKLARNYSVIPDLEAMYATVKALYAVEAIVSEHDTSWGQKKMHEVTVRVSRLLASLEAYPCMRFRPEHKKEIDKTRILLQERLDQFIDVLTKRAEMLSREAKPRTEKMVSSLALLDAMGDAAKLQVALYRIERCPTPPLKDKDKDKQKRKQHKSRTQKP